MTWSNSAGRPSEIGCLTVGLLDGELVLRAVEALGPPAAGDGLLELLPVRVGEGGRGVVVDDQPLAPLDRLEERLLVGVGPLACRRRLLRGVLVVQQQDVVLGQVLVGQVLGGGGRHVDLEPARLRRGSPGGPGWSPSSRGAALSPGDDQHLDRLRVGRRARAPWPECRPGRSAAARVRRIVVERLRLGSGSSAREVKSRPFSSVVERDRPEDGDGHVEGVGQVAIRVEAVAVPGGTPRPTRYANVWA